MPKPFIRCFLGALAVLLSSATLAQNTLDNVDWVEEVTPPPPAYSKDNLILIDMPVYVSLKVGVDPATVSVGADGIVRYVVLMINATGSVNAAFEGIRCFSDEVKTYARTSASGEWRVLPDPQWKAVNDNMPSRHAQAIARQGACVNRLTTTVPDTLKALGKPKQMPVAR
jgi:hypothetical protein